MAKLPRIDKKEMLAHRQRADRGYCTKCGLVMDDSEPMGREPEWCHKVTGRCPNDGESFVPGTEWAREHGVTNFKRKRDR